MQIETQERGPAPPLTEEKTMVQNRSRKARIATAALGVTAVAAGSVFGINTAASAVASTDTAITKLSLKKGTSAGGTAVTITGKNFTGTIAAADVTFGGTAATNIIVQSSTQILAVAPAGSGAVRVKVTANTIDSADTTADDYTYITPLDAVAPATMLNPQGKSTFVVTTTGALGASTAAFKLLKITAKVNGVVSPVAWKTATTATVTAPVGAPSATFVSVALDLDGVAGTPDTTHVQYAGIITKLSKTSGPLVGVDTIVVTGVGLAGATAFNFGTPTATCNQTAVPAAKLDTTWNCAVPTASSAGAVTVVPTLSAAVGATNYGTLAGATYTYTNM
jgi:hypothetical protein